MALPISCIRAFPGEDLTTVKIRMKAKTRPTAAQSNESETPEVRMDKAISVINRAEIRRQDIRGIRLSGNRFVIALPSAAPAKRRRLPSPKNARLNLAGSGFIIRKPIEAGGESWRGIQ